MRCICEEGPKGALRVPTASLRAESPKGSPTLRSALLRVSRGVKWRLSHGLAFFTRH